MKLWHELTCDACGEVIEDWDQIRLLRDVTLIPENPSVCHVHTDCVETFKQQQDGAWRSYHPSSPSAGWFMPLLIRPPVEHEEQLVYQTV